MEKLTRREAKMLGRKTYFTGEPCSRGGIAERSTSSGTCLCAECRSSRSQHNNEYNKRRRAEDPEGAIRRERDYYHANKDRFRSERRKWHAKNSRRISDKGRSLTAKESARKRTQIWKQNNHERTLELTRRRILAKNMAVPCWYSEFDELVYQEAISLCRQRKSETGVQWNIDHMVPLKADNASGLHCSENWQVIPKFLNARKHNKMWLYQPHEWVKFAWAH